MKQYCYPANDKLPVCECVYVPVIVDVDPVVLSIKEAGESTQVKHGRKFLRSVVDKKGNDLENGNPGAE
jgi:hypothetical protein